MNHSYRLILWYLLFLFLSFHAQAQSIQLDSTFLRTMAGDGTSGANNGAGSASRFNVPAGICSDTAGNIYVADFANNLIRKITTNPTVIVSTFAGSGVAGSNNGTGTSASFNGPSGVVCDLAGNVYVADQFNQLIRRITPTGVVSTYAGNFSVGSGNGPALSASFNFPCGIAIDLSGNLYIADQYNHLIRKITITGVVTTLAGTKNVAGYIDAQDTLARFNIPTGVAADLSGNVYVADQNNHRIRKITPSGLVSTVAGSGVAAFADGTSSLAQFHTPTGLIVNAAGDIFVADRNNQRIRKITINGEVSTLVGDGNYQSQDGNGILGRLGGPYGIGLDNKGRVIVTEVGNHYVKRLESTRIENLVGELGVPSTASSFVVTAKNLSSNLSITAPTNFQVSLSPSSGFSSSLNIAPLGGIVNRTIYVRLNSATLAGLISGNISLSATGASTVLLPVSGSISCATIGLNQTYAKDAVQGVAYTYTYSASAIASPRFRIVAGSLPAGLVLDSITGVVSGTPTAVGAFNFTLRAVGSIDCFTQSNYSMLVVNTPLVRFRYNLNACTNRTVSFFDSSLIASSYFWQFGDGTTSTLRNPSKTFSRDSIYKVKLTINGNLSDSQFIGVHTNAVIGTLTTSADCNFQYTFNGAPNGIYYTYYWGFGANSTGSDTTLRVPNRRYTSGGPKTVTLQILSGFRCPVNATPLNFNATAYAPTVIAGVAISAPGGNFCSNSRTITNTSTAGMLAYTFSVNGAAFLPIVSSVNLNGLTKGLYAVRLATHNGVCFDTATINFNISGATANFSSASSVCNTSVQFTNQSITEDSLPGTYSWVFGSPAKGTSTQVNPSFNFPSSGVDTVFLTLRASSGCTNTIKKPVTINPPLLPPPNFIASKSTTCTNRFTFSNTSTGYSSYLWDFGDGTSFSGLNASRGFKDTGNYSVTLYGFAPTCTSTFTRIVRVDSGAFGSSANFTPSSTEIIYGSLSTFTFLNTSSHLGNGFNNYFHWNLGDGQTSENGSVYDKTYADSGTYVIRLVAQGNTGCRDTAYKKVRVVPTLTAKFGHTQSCANRAVNFIDSSYLATSWLWNFGDGTTSTLKNPSHTYAKDTIYRVVLITNGLVQAEKILTIASNAPITAINYTVNCAFEHRFTGAPAGNSYTYHWGFTGGTGSDTTLRIPVRSYTIPGPTAVNLTVFSNGRCPVSPAQLVFTPALTSNGFTTKASIVAPVGNLCSTTRTIINQGTGATLYTWNLDNGPFDTLFSTENLVALTPGFHTVKVTGFKAFCFDTLVQSFFISSPSVSFISIPSTCNQQVNFVSTSTTSDNGSMVYNWVFGSPQKGTDNVASTSFNFGVPGRDTAYLTITSSSGCAITAKQAVIVGSGTGPNARFSFTYPNTTCKNLVQFNNTTGAGFTYAWDFGDTTFSNFQSPSHGFGDTGWYSVRLTASTPTCTSSVSKQVRIDSGAVGPVARIKVDPISQPIDNHNYIFLNTSYHLGNGWNTKYKWQFSDGYLDTLNNSVFNKKFANPGKYLATLTATNNLGCIDTYTQEVDVFAVLLARFGFNNNSCANRTIQFKDSSLLATNYKWYFGDGDSSTIKDPTHTYARDSIYNVMLIVNGLDTLVKQVVIATTPVVGLLSASSGCDNIYTFSGAPVGFSQRYLWSFATGSYGSDTTLLNPTRAYTVPGSTQVNLQVSSFGRCAVTAPTLNFVAKTASIAAVAKFDIVAPIGQTLCSSNRVILNQSSLGLSSYTYSLDGGVFKTLGLTETLNGLNIGYHQIKMAVNNGACADTTVKIFNISVPTPNFSALPSSCNQVISFTNQSVSNDLGVISYLWTFGKPSKGTSTEINPTFDFGTPGIDTVNLVATSLSGCSVSIQKQVVVGSGNATLGVNFDWAPALNSCNNRIQFDNLTPADTSFRFNWSFPDGSFDTRFELAKAFADTGLQSVRLTAQKGNCFSSVQKLVYIPRDANGPVSKLSTAFPIQPFDVHSYNFSNENNYIGAGWIAANRWLFGDGTIDSVNTFSFNKKYARPGKYTVSLVATGSTGCNDTASIIIDVTPVLTANFGVTGISCANRNVQFIDSTILATSYRWDFGDGDTSNLAAPSHTYAKDSIYKVTLLVNGILSSSKTIEIITSPNPGFTYTANSCGNKFTFTPNEIGTDLSYVWSANKNYWVDSAAANGVFLFPATESAVVYLLTTRKGTCSALSAPDTIYGVEGPRAKVSIVSADFCSNTINVGNLSTKAIASFYSFDGSVFAPFTSTLVFNNLSKGAHTLVVIAQGNTCFDTLVQVIQISDIVGDFTALANNCDRGVVFDAVFSYSPALEATYAWDFGDGTTSNVMSPTHVYLKPGNVIVSLRVDLNNGCFKSFSKLVAVNDTSGPGSTFTAQSLTNADPCKIGYEFLATTPTGVKFAWNFGDGYATGLSKEKKVFHSYANAGNYFVVLTSVNSLGCGSFSDSLLVAVTVPGRANPIAGFLTLDTTMCLSSQDFNFVNTSYMVGPGFVQSNVWDFGDGNKNSVNASIYGKRYASTGNYTVSLVAISDGGCKDTFNLTVAVVPDAVCNPIGLNQENLGLQCILYPNPNAGEFTLSLNRDLSGVVVFVRDLSGRLVHQADANLKGSHQLNLQIGDLREGQYLLELITDSGEIVRKPFIIVK